MNVFVIGSSGSGKSTLAKKLVERYGFNHVKPSAGLRASNPQRDDETTRDYVQRITDVAIAKLQADPNYFIDYMRGQAANNANIYDGVRNPRDFVALFNPAEDLVVHVTSDDARDLTTFEHSGIAAIVCVANWMHDHMGAKPVVMLARGEDIELKTVTK